MPTTVKKYILKSRRRAKTVVKKIARKNNIGRVPRPFVQMGRGFPMRLTTKLAYSESQIMSFPIGGPLVRLDYAMNGLFRPLSTVTNHKPYYFSQYMALYNHYTVIASKITVKFCPYETNAVAANVVIYLNDDTTAPTVMTTLQEQSKGVKGLLVTDGGKITTLSMGWSAKKTFGGSILANDELKGDALANPAELSFATVAIAAADLVTAVSAIAQVYIEYIVVFSELKDVAGST